MLISFLIAARDAIIAAALAWVGVSVEQRTEASAPCKAGAQACETAR